MEVILDGRSRTLDVSDCANLAELVARAEGFEPSSEDRIVVGIEIDGQRLSPEEMQGLELHRLDAIERVAIERRSSHSLARSVLRRGALYSQEIVKAIDRTVGHFRAGRSDLANDLLARVSDSLSVFVGINASVADVLNEQRAELMGFQAELHPWLVKMIEAQSMEDPIGIGDLLEFEIGARIERWGVRMGALAEIPSASEDGERCGAAV